MDSFCSRLLSLASVGLLACGPSTPSATTGTVTNAPASDPGAPALALASARPQDGAVALCGPVKADEPKRFVLAMAQVLEHDETVAWEGMQSARFRQSGSIDPGLNRMRFESWKQGLRAHLADRTEMACRIEGQDTSIACDTKKPLKIRVAREACVLKLDDN